MRLLITIPHFFGAAAPGQPNLSGRPALRQQRLSVLVATLSTLHQNFGRDAFALDHAGRRAVHVPPEPHHALDIVVCTSGPSHLLGELDAVRPLFRHHASDVPGPLLGFECHRMLAAARGGYDYYGYVEDDILVTDPMFFDKRRAFDNRFGTEALLQPNRYEALATGPVRKLYVDHRLHLDQTAAYQNPNDSPPLALEFAGRPIRFERTTYPAAGCFFLSAAQLDRWIADPRFGEIDTSFLGPLDSAATLSIMRRFRVYKPALGNAWFLEVLHGSPRWIPSVARDVPLVRDP